MFCYVILALYNFKAYSDTAVFAAPYIERNLCWRGGVSGVESDTCRNTEKSSVSSIDNFICYFFVISVVLAKLARLERVNVCFSTIMTYYFVRSQKPMYAIMSMLFIQIDILCVITMFLWQKTRPNPFPWRFDRSNSAEPRSAISSDTNIEANIWIGLYITTGALDNLFAWQVVGCRDLNHSVYSFKIAVLVVFTRSRRFLVLLNFVDIHKLLLVFL